MRRWRLIAAVLLVLIPSFAYADWIKVPAMGSGKPLVDPYRPDLSGLPVVVDTYRAVVSSFNQGAPKEFLVWVDVDTAGFQPGPKMVLMTRGEVIAATAGRNIDLSFIEKRLDRQSAAEKFLRWAWSWVQPVAAWAAGFCDNFNRANSANLGGNWTVDAGGHDAITISGNKIQPTNSNTEASEAYTASASPNDQESGATIATFTGAGASYAGLLIRDVSPGVNVDYYRMLAVRNDAFYGGKTTILSVVATGSETVLATETATTWAAGDTMKYRIVGSNLTIFRNGATLLTASDATHSSGSPGIDFYTQETTLSNVQLDDWCGGEIPSAAAKRRTVIVE